MNLRNTQTILLQSDWFYDILDLDYKGARTTLLELEWFYDIDLKKSWLILLYIGLGMIKLINQAGMSFEKFEDFLELFVKQLVIQSKPISQG